MRFRIHCPTYCPENKSPSYWLHRREILSEDQYGNRAYHKGAHDRLQEHWDNKIVPRDCLTEWCWLGEPFHSQECSLSNSPCSLRKLHHQYHITQLTKMKDDFITNSHYLTCTILFKWYFLNLGVEGLNHSKESSRHLIPSRSSAVLHACAGCEDRLSQLSTISRT